MRGMGHVQPTAHVLGRVPPGHPAVLPPGRPAALQGARKVEWNVRVPLNRNKGFTVPMFVGLLNDT